MLSNRCHYSPEPVISLTRHQEQARNQLLEALGSGHVRQVPTPCLCGNTNGDVIAQKDRWGLPVTTVLCRQCGIVRTSPRLPDEFLPTFYERDYRLLMDGISHPTEGAFQLQQRRGHETLGFIQQHRAITPDLKVYEVGCSAGGVLQPFLAKGCTTAGSDYDIRFLENARRLGINTRHGGWEHLQDLPRPDILILSHVVEHLNDPVDFVRSVASLLKPDGLLFVAVPGLDHIRLDYCGDLIRYLQICHTFHFTKHTLLGCLRSAGLSPLLADDSVRALATHGPVADRLPETTEDPEVLLRRITDMENEFVLREARFPRRARQFAVGMKRLFFPAR